MWYVWFCGECSCKHSHWMRAQALNSISYHKREWWHHFCVRHKKLSPFASFIISQWQWCVHIHSSKMDFSSHHWLTLHRPMRRRVTRRRPEPSEWNPFKNIKFQDVSSQLDFKVNRCARIYKMSFWSNSCVVMKQKGEPHQRCSSQIFRWQKPLVTAFY